MPGVEHLDGADGRPPRALVCIDATAHGVELAGKRAVELEKFRYDLTVHVLGKRASPSPFVASLVVDGEQAQRPGDALVRPLDALHA